MPSSSMRCIPWSSRARRKYGAKGNHQQISGHVQILLVLGAKVLVAVLITPISFIEVMTQLSYQTSIEASHSLDS